MASENTLEINDETQRKIGIICRQTDLTEEQAKQKLLEFDNNEILVIKSYFGIQEKKPEKVKSVNQEIFRQLRGHLDKSMRDYNKRVENGEVKKVV